MIAMSMISTYDEYRRDHMASAPVYSVPTHPMRQAMLRVLSMVRLGLGGVAAMDNGRAFGDRLMPRRFIGEVREET